LISIDLEKISLFVGPGIQVGVGGNEHLKCLEGENH